MEGDSGTVKGRGSTLQGGILQRGHGSTGPSLETVGSKEASELNRYRSTRDPNASQGVKEDLCREKPPIPKVRGGHGGPISRRETRENGQRGKDYPLFLSYWDP